MYSSFNIRGAEEDYIRDANKWNMDTNLRKQGTNPILPDILISTNIKNTKLSKNKQDFLHITKHTCS